MLPLQVPEPVLLASLVPVFQRMHMTAEHFLDVEVTSAKERIVTALKRITQEAACDFLLELLELTDTVLPARLPNLALPASGVRR